MGLLIDMIDVGQGDSFLLSIDGPGGEVNVLIDAGLRDAGAIVLNYVKKYAPGGLDLIVATHIDNDHVGGMATVLTYAPMKQGARFAINVPPAIKTHWTPVRSTLEKYKGVVSFGRLLDAVDAVKTLCALANKRGLTLVDALQGRWWSYGGVNLNVLNPTPERLARAWEESRLDEYLHPGWDANLVSIVEAMAEAPSTSPENDASVVIEITVDGVPSALMASDAGAAVLREVTAGKRYPFLKVPHHGSDTGLDDELIQQFRPVRAAIPVGENPHGHPCLEILDMLRESGARTFCSTKTKDCRKSCSFTGGDISFPIGKPLRPGWNLIDNSKCQNNR